MVITVSESAVYNHHSEEVEFRSDIFRSQDFMLRFNIAPVIGFVRNTHKYQDNEYNPFGFFAINNNFYLPKVYEDILIFVGYYVFSVN